MYNIYIICISLRMRVHVCVRHLPTDCDRTDRSSFENYSTHFFFLPRNSTLPPFLSMGSIRHLVFLASLTTRENERIIGQGTRVRSSYGATFLPKSFPIHALFSSWKRKLPRKIDRRAIAATRKISSSFFSFFFFLIHERDFS